MPAFYPEGDEPKLADPSGRSLHKINNLLKSIEAKTGSTTITGPVTVSNEVEVTNSTGNPIPVSGTVALDSNSLAALESISVTFPATQNVNVTNAGLNVSVTNLPATQPVSGTIGTFNNNLVNAGSVFSYGAVGSFGTFDAGVDADYVEFRRDGGGGGFTHNLSLSLSDSPFSAGATTAATALVFNDKFPSSSLDTHAYRFSNTNLNSGTNGNFILNLRQGSTKYRYVRVDVTGGGGGGWVGVFASYKSSGLISSGIGVESTRIPNRVPIAGVVDINSCTRELPVNDSALISSVGTTSEAAATSDLAVSSISGLFRRLLQRLTTLLPANLTVSSTRLLVDGSGVTQPTRETQPTGDYAINTTAVAAFSASGSALQSASFDAGANADYVVISLSGAGSAGAFYYDLSTNNSAWDAGNTAGGFSTYYDLPATSATDAYSYKSVGGTSLFGSTRTVFAGRFIVPLTQSQPGSGAITTYRYLRLNLPASNGGWRYRFTSYKSVDSLLAASVPGNPSTTRVAGRVDVGFVSNLPALPTGTNTIGSVNVLGGNATAVKVDGSAVTQPVSLASAPVTPVTDNGGSLTVDGTVTVNDMTSGNAKTKIVDSTGADVSYIPAGTAGTPSSSVLSVQGISGGVSLPISGTVTASVSNFGSIATDIGGNAPGLGIQLGFAAGEEDYRHVGPANPLPIVGTVNTYPQQGTTSTNTDFSSLTSAQLVPAVSNRESLTVYNEGPGTLFINVGGSCSTTSYQVRLFAGDYWEAPAGQLSLQHSGIFGTAGTARAVQVS
jgi:hypothetical protein